MKFYVELLSNVRATPQWQEFMLLSQGNLAIFFNGALAAVLTSAALVLLAWPLAASSLQRKRATRPVNV